jgi:hypothetical protein
MVKGMLSLLTICPHEVIEADFSSSQIPPSLSHLLIYFFSRQVAHLRKELLIAARHILATDLRVKFVPFMEKLFDENILLGKWNRYRVLTVPLDTYLKICVSDPHLSTILVMDPRSSTDLEFMLEPKMVKFRGFSEV